MRTQRVRIVGRYGSGADGVGTERLCRDAGGRFAAAGFRSGGAGGVVAAKFRSVVRYGGRSAFLLYQDIVKQRITPPPKTLSLSGEGNAVEIGMESGYAR